MKASVTRDSVSGHFIVNDIPPGEYSGEELSRLAQSQADALNAANEKDQAKGFTEAGNPALGDAMSKEVKPSYYDANSKADCYGSL